MVHRKRTGKHCARVDNSTTHHRLTNALVSLCKHDMTNITIDVEDYGTCVRVRGKAYMPVVTFIICTEEQSTIIFYELRTDDENQDATDAIESTIRRTLDAL